MKSKHLMSAILATALITTPAARVAASDLVNGIVGGIIGGAIVSGATRNKPTKRVYVNNGNSAARAATRAANRETQTALNYFGYPAGTPDGVLGRRSRAAISSMQAYLGNPVTGKLTAFERDILVGAYHRGISGSYETVQMVSKSPDGARSLLAAQRDIMTGNTTPTRRTVGYAGLPLEVSDAVDEIAESSDPSAEQLLQRSGFIQLADLNGDGNTDYIMDTSFSGSSFWCNAAQCKSIVFVSTAEGYRRNDLLQANPTPANFNCIGGSCTVNSTVLASTETTVEAAPTETVATSLPSLGTLGTFGTPPFSMAAHCNKVAMASGNEGMIIDAAAITDPAKVLDQQFCVARQSAMDDETRMIRQLGVTLAQVDSQCAQYGEVLKPYVASLSLKRRSEMMSDMAGFVASAGIDPAQLQTTAKVCVGAGYRLDNAEMALGTGLLLVQLGDLPYGELMGHHLHAGLGVSVRESLALDWFNASIAALDDGAPVVFAPNQFGRTSLIAAAVTNLAGGTQAVLTPLVPAASGKAKLGTLGASAKKSK